MKEPNVAIIILTMNPDEKIFREALDSLKEKTQYKNYHIIISDNGSRKKHLDMIKKEYPSIDLIKNGKNLGFPIGVNVGIDFAMKKYNPDYYFLLNDDIKIIDKKWLHKLIETAESDKKIGIVGGNLIYPDGVVQNARGRMKGPFIILEKEVKEGAEESQLVGGGAFLIKKAVVEKIGYLDGIYTPYLLEETDYCLRAGKAGFKIVTRGDAKIIHYKGLTIESSEKAVKRNAIRLKNDLIFSTINLKLHHAFFRVFFYIPIVIMFKKRNEKKRATPNNICLRKKPFANFANLLKGYVNLLRSSKLILKKRRERNLNLKVYY